MSRIGLIGENSIEYIEKLLDIWNNGDCAVLIDYRLPLKAILRLLRLCKVSICYLEYEIIEGKSNFEEIEIRTFTSKNKSIMSVPESIYEMYKPNYNKTDALILFSSGTTGKQKGIRLSHYSITKNADAIARYMQLSKDDSMFIVKSFIHVSTLVGELLVCLKNKLRFYISPTLTTPQQVLEALEIQKVTVLCLNPTLLKIYARYEKIRRHHLSSLKAIYTSGSIADINILTEAQQAFSSASILNVYGLTEAGPRLTAQTIGQQNRLGSVGKPISEVEIKILGEDGVEVNSGEKGLIYAKTPCLFSGYIAHTKMQAQVDEGWLNTKDIGYFDNDGNLYIVGRSDNMIHVGSHNVHPEEIEEVIRGVAEVEDCVVVGVSNHLYGSILVCKYIAPKDKSDNIKKYCQEHLAPYEVPVKFVRVDDIPKTFNGKVNRAAISDYLDGVV